MRNTLLPGGRALRLRMQPFAHAGARVSDRKCLWLAASLNIDPTALKYCKEGFLN